MIKNQQINMPIVDPQCYSVHTAPYIELNCPLFPRCLKKTALVKSNGKDDSTRTQPMYPLTSKYSSFITLSVEFFKISVLRSVLESSDIYTLIPIVIAENPRDLHDRIHHCASQNANAVRLSYPYCPSTQSYLPDRPLDRSPHGFG